jgi:predicted nucleic acid-binding protein
MRIFVDTNILVAVLNKELPLFDTAARVLSLASKKDFIIFTSPICLAIAFYFSEKKSGAEKAKEKIGILCEHIRIAPSTKTSVKKAIQNPKVLDLEDGFEYYAAREAKCDYIITEDLEDFHFSEISIMCSKEFLKQLKV